MILALASTTLALASGASAQDGSQVAGKIDGGLFEEVSKARVLGKPMPAAFQPVVPLTTGDDAEACAAYQKGNLALATRLATSPKMRDALRTGDLPASCPDPEKRPEPFAFPYEQGAKPEGGVEIEHPTPGTCGEVGLWDRQSDVATNRATAHTIEANVQVSNIPPQARCDGNTNPSNASQHNSLHARSSGGSLCLEIVAQRWSGGDITMWGYDCGQGTGGTANTMTVSNYTPDQMRFWMSNGGESSTTWATWFFRYDTNQWVFLGNVTNRSSRMRPWAESSGYNQTAERHTWFANYSATNTAFGTWAPRFRCAVSEALDAHQVMRQSPSAGGSVVFDHTTDGVMCR